MNLTGPQVKQLRNALMAAFPSERALEQMVREELDQRLAAISEENNLTTITFDLIKWAEAQNKLEALVNGAREASPNNGALQAFVKILGFDSTPITATLPAPDRDIPLVPIGYETIDARAVARYNSEAANHSDSNRCSIYVSGGRVEFWHIAAGQDVRRNLTEELLNAAALCADEPGMRFQLVTSRAGNGKSTFLLRLAYELAQRHNAFVVLARDKISPDYSFLREKCIAADAGMLRSGPRIYLLLDDAYLYHAPLLQALKFRPIANLTIIATSRHAAIVEDIPLAGPRLCNTYSHLDNLTTGEAGALIDRMQSCNMLRYEKAPFVLESAMKGQMPLFLAIALLTSTHELEKQVPKLLKEMNSGQEVNKQSRSLWHPFLQTYFAVATCHAWNVETPQVVLPAITGLDTTTVRTLLCDAINADSTSTAREYLHGKCNSSWRTIHQLIASSVVNYLADEEETDFDRWQFILKQVNPLTYGEGPQAASAKDFFVSVLRSADPEALLSRGKVARNSLVH